MLRETFYEPERKHSVSIVLLLHGIHSSSLSKNRDFTEFIAYYGQGASSKVDAVISCSAWQGSFAYGTGRMTRHNISLKQPGTNYGACHK